jgi:hypothetical protein
MNLIDRIDIRKSIPKSSHLNILSSIANSMFMIQTEEKEAAKKVRLIISRKNVQIWKTNTNIEDMTIYYNKHGTRISDVFKPSVSNAYAFILDNRFSSTEHYKTKKVGVTLVHAWQQEVKESQLKDREVSDFKSQSTSGS